MGGPGVDFRLRAVRQYLEGKADRNKGVGNALEHLKENLDRWLDNHVPSET